MTAFVLGSRTVCGRTTETTSAIRRSEAAWARISCPRKPVAPVRRTRSLGLRPRAASAARASSWSRAIRAFTSRSDRCVASRNWKKTSRSTTPIACRAPRSTAFEPVIRPSLPAIRMPSSLIFLIASRTESSLPVTWTSRLARNEAVTSSGFLSRCAWMRSSSGSMGRRTSRPVTALIRAM